MRIIVHKANRLLQAEPTEDVTIEATVEFESNSVSLEETEARFDSEARDILKGLRLLPQGTIHRLIGHLLRQYSVGYIGRMDT